MIDPFRLLATIESDKLEFDLFPLKDKRGEDILKKAPNSRSDKKTMTGEGLEMIFRSAGKFLSLFLVAAFSFIPAVRAETLSDEALLEKIQHSAFNYFIEEANPQNGLVRDRAHNFRKGATQSASSIAATGFGLSAYPVGVSRGWISREDALGRTRRSLEFFLNTAAQEHGFFYHFLTMDGGKRAIHSELSPIDTALFLAGVLFSAEYYKDPVITALAAKIYERVDWPWMLNGGKTLAMSWSPETGFSRHRWDHYNESKIGRAHV